MFDIKYHVSIISIFITIFFCCSFEQEVLGGPIPVSGSTPILEAVPVALPLPAVVRPIIGTNTYRQVCTLLTTRVSVDALRGVLQRKLNSIFNNALWGMYNYHPECQFVSLSFYLFLFHRFNRHWKQEQLVLVVLPHQALLDQVIGTCV